MKRIIEQKLSYSKFVSQNQQFIKETMSDIKGKNRFVLTLFSKIQEDLLVLLLPHRCIEMMHSTLYHIFRNCQDKLNFRIGNINNVETVFQDENTFRSFPSGTKPHEAEQFQILC